MIEPNFSLLKLILDIGKRILGAVKRPTVSLRRAPANMFCHIQPGTSMAKVKEILGVPSFERNGVLSYKFSDAFIQISTQDGISVTGVCLALPKIGRKSNFQIFPLKFKLGKDSLECLLIDGEPVYEYSDSSKHHCFQAKLYFGLDGNYQEYVFGVLSAQNIFPPKTRWCSDGEGKSGVVISAPSEIIPNFVCVFPFGCNDVQFDFWVFR